MQVHSAGWSPASPLLLMALLTAPIWALPSILSQGLHIQSMHLQFGPCTASVEHSGQIHSGHVQLTEWTSFSTGAGCTPFSTWSTSSVWMISSRHKHSSQSQSGGWGILSGISVKLLTFAAIGWVFDSAPGHTHSGQSQSSSCFSPGLLTYKWYSGRVNQFWNGSQLVHTSFPGGAFCFLGSAQGLHLQSMQSQSADSGPAPEIWSPALDFFWGSAHGEHLHTWQSHAAAPGGIISTKGPHYFFATLNADHSDQDATSAYCRLEWFIE